MPWRILHRCSLSVPPKGSGQGNYRYVNLKNRKGDNDLGKIILETKSVYWRTGKKEEGLIGV